MSGNLVPNKHHKSVFENEQEALKALIQLHCPWGIEIDPMYFKGSFYKDGVEAPSYKFDINPRIEGVEQGDAKHLPFNDESFNSIILDPLFLFGIHGKAKQYYTSSTMGIYPDFKALADDYKLFLDEAYRLLTIKGVLIFKCQDYTDSKTTMTHSLVYNWATERGFYAKDLAILVKPNKIYNGNTTQRHLRKIHTYFWVFQKTKKQLTDLQPSDPDTTLELSKAQILEIIGDDIDTQALVQAREREQAKHAFTVNETKEAQRLRLCKAFGIEIPEMSHRELREWLKEMR